MDIGDRVKLIHAPAGWGDVTGHVIHDDQADQFATDDMVLVEWANGETCYESPENLEVAST